MRPLRARERPRSRALGRRRSVIPGRRPGSARGPRRSAPERPTCEANVIPVPSDGRSLATAGPDTAHGSAATCDCFAGGSRGPVAGRGARLRSGRAVRIVRTALVRHSRCPSWDRPTDLGSRDQPGVARPTRRHGGKPPSRDTAVVRRHPPPVRAAGHEGAPRSGRTTSALEETASPYGATATSGEKQVASRCRSCLMGSTGRSSTPARRPGCRPPRTRRGRGWQEVA